MKLNSLHFSPSSLTLQITGLSAVSNILLLGLPSLQLLNHYNILRLVHCAFEAFGTELDLQEVCCRCLARLMEKYQDIHHFIGRDSPKIQLVCVCLCTCVVCVMVSMSVCACVLCM